MRARITLIACLTAALSLALAYILTTAIIKRYPPDIPGLNARLAWAFALSLVPFAYLSGYLARRAIKPLITLGEKKPLHGNIYPELLPVVDMLGVQSSQITKHMESLKNSRDAFAAITGHMSEALVVLDSRGLVMSLNQSAARLFETEAEDCVGRHVEFLTRSRPLLDAVEQARQGFGVQHTHEIGSKHYEVILSPVLSGEQAGGVVMLLLDVTERLEAEQMRKEFTANVTHELKTPLTSIAGYAELIKENVAEQSDVPVFAGRIHDESRRLVALIDDILTLSRLDEMTAPLPKESVDILALSQEIAGRLSQAALDKGVDIATAGVSAVVNGVRSLLDEMIFNLCDNAVKYNRPGGNVAVSVYEKEGEVVLSIADTGIGIPTKDQRRVFERFYRVDKSHSKSTGGSGLGLSIVKHAALYHGAKIELSSRPGTGTLIRVVFPKNISN